MSIVSRLLIGALGIALIGYAVMTWRSKRMPFMVGKVAGSGGGRHPASISVSIEICGKMDGADDRGWRALGMTLVTSTVYFKKGSSYNTETAGKAEVFERTLAQRSADALAGVCG